MTPRRPEVVTVLVDLIEEGGVAIFVRKRLVLWKPRMVLSNA
jgi:hypothetical protein